MGTSSRLGWHRELGLFLLSFFIDSASLMPVVGLGLWGGEGCGFDVFDLDGEAKPFNGQPARKSRTVRATLRSLEKLREPLPATVCRPDLGILAPITIISQVISGAQET